MIKTKNQLLEILTEAFTEDGVEQALQGIAGLDHPTKQAALLKQILKVVGPKSQVSDEQLPTIAKAAANAVRTGQDTNISPEAGGPGSAPAPSPGIAEPSGKMMGPSSHSLNPGVASPFLGADPTSQMSPQDIEPEPAKPSVGQRLGQTTGKVADWLRGIPGAVSNFAGLGQPSPDAPITTPAGGQLGWDPVASPSAARSMPPGGNRWDWEVEPRAQQPSQIGKLKDLSAGVKPSRLPTLKEIYSSKRNK